MANVQHTLSGATDPAAAPPSIGAHYTNTLTKKRWISSGTDSVADWGTPLPGSRRVIEDSVTTIELDVDIPVTLWNITTLAERTIKLPQITKAGVYEIVLVLENNGGAPQAARIVNADEVVAVVHQTIFDVRRQSATYYRLSAWLSDPDRAPTYWTVLEVGHYTYPLPTRYISANDSDMFATDTLFLSDEMSRTVWVLSLDVARNLVLPKLNETFSINFFDEIDLVVWNQSPSAQNITISPNGLPLTGHTSLSVASGTCMVFKLTYFVGGAEYRWSLVNSYAV